MKRVLTLLPLLSVLVLSRHARADDTPSPTLPPPPAPPPEPAKEPPPPAPTPDADAPKTKFTEGTTVLPKNKPPVKERHRLRHTLLLGGAVGIYVGWEVLAKGQLAPSACRICAVDSVDVSIRNSLVWKDTKLANSISNYTAFVFEPLTAAGLLFWASSNLGEERWVTFGDDALAVAEATAYTELVVEIFKYTLGRQRPYAHYEPTGSTITNDDNLSLVSGHTALAFSIATSAGVVAHRRHYNLEPLVWAAGMTFATATGYLRIAADKHYFTDVVAGAIVGAAGGIFVPWLAGSLPGVPEITPVEGGGATVGLAGNF